MAARRCGICGVNWPTDFKEYDKCPSCGQKTSYMSDEDPDPPDDLFERFYWDNWDAERERRGDPSPELLGAIDAAEQLTKERMAARAAVEDLLDDVGAEATA